MRHRHRRVRTWPSPARVRLIVTATVLGCVGYGAYLMSGTASGPVVLTVVAAVVAAAAAAQLLLPASGRGGHLTAVAFAAAAVLLLPAAASVSGVIGGLGPFDTPFESPKTAHNNQLLAAAAPRLTTAVQRLELQTPPGDALFGTDTSGLAENDILYSGREVLPIGGYLGNVPARRWPRCRPTSAAATCGDSCCRCHRRARTRGCGGSSRTAPGSPRPRTAARSRTRTSSADSPRPSRSPPSRQANAATPIDGNRTGHRSVWLPWPLGLYCGPIARRASPDVCGP